MRLGAVRREFLDEVKLGLACIGRATEAFHTSEEVNACRAQEGLGHAGDDRLANVDLWEMHEDRRRFDCRQSRGNRACITVQNRKGG